MIWTVLHLIGWIALLWFLWSAVATLRGALQGKLSMLWMIGIWQLVGAVGAWWVATAPNEFSLGVIIGLILIALNPVFWTLGNVSNRLLSHGIRLGELMMFR